MPAGYQYILDDMPDVIRCNTIVRWAKALADGSADPAIPRRYTADRLLSHYAGVCSCKKGKRT